MSPDYYVSQLKLYARYVRNYNPAQTGDQTMRRIAVGADGSKTDYVEAVMKAWQDKVWSWDIEGLSLHSYTTVGWPPAHPSATSSRWRTSAASRGLSSKWSTRSGRVIVWFSTALADPGPAWLALSGKQLPAVQRPSSASPTVVTGPESLPMPG